MAQCGESQVWDSSCPGKWDGPPGVIMGFSNYSENTLPQTFPSMSLTSYLGALDSHLKISESPPPSQFTMWKLAPDTQPQQWLGLPIPAIVPISVKISGPQLLTGPKPPGSTRSWAQTPVALPEHLLESWVAQEESCLAVEEWEEGGGFSPSDRVRGHELASR